MHGVLGSRVRAVASVGAFMVLVLCPTLYSAQRGSNAGNIYGSWYLALDAHPYGLPEGTNLPGLAMFHRDGTFVFVDGGDFGGLPFDTRDTAQFGTWRESANGIQAVSLFIQADALTGEVKTWVKVQLRLALQERDRLVGTVNISTLACEEPAPFPVLGCPDPVAHAADFQAIPPFNIPILFRRLIAQ